MKHPGINLGILLILLTSCIDYQPADQAYVGGILELRQAKDLDFRNSEHSPILPAERGDFSGLNYFDADVSWRFEGPILRADSAIIDTILGSKANDKRPALRYGSFQFQRNGSTFKLLIYKILRSNQPEDKYLFLGFTDQTSDETTYGAGRYIDLNENEQNHYVVDFNLAYNPYCAYNPRYSCAVPPLQNRLPLAVNAGEKLYRESH